MSSACVSDPVPRSATDGYSVGNAVALDSRSGVHGVAPDVEQELLVSQHTCDQVPTVNAQSNAPRRRQIATCGDHVETCLDALEIRVQHRRQKPGGGHERVADGLDLLEAVALRDLLEPEGDPGQSVQHLLGIVGVAVLGEADDVGEQHGHTLVTPRLYPTVCFELVGDLVRQDRSKQAIRLMSLGLALLEQPALRIALPAWSPNACSRWA